MKKINLYLVATLAVAVLASCSKETGTQTRSGEATSVQMKINQGVLDSKAQTTAIADGTPVTFTGGYLYFVDGGGGQITNRVQIITSGTPDNETTVSYSDLVNSPPGATLKNIKSNADKVYFIGNVPTSVGTLPSSGNISAVLTKMVGVATQADATGGVANVSIYGDGTVTPGVDPAPATATFTVAPIVARLQVPKVLAGGIVTGFQLDGIFVNNFFHQVQLNGITAPANKISYTSTDIFTPGDVSVPLYSAANDKIIYDYESTSGLGGFHTVNTKEYHPDPSDLTQIWAYNVFAGDVPTIVFKIKDITTSDGSVYANPQYVTVKGMIDDNTSTQLTKLTGGKTYTFTGGITFDEDNITGVPEVSAVNAIVDVTLLPWSDVYVTPKF